MSYPTCQCPKDGPSHLRDCAEIAALRARPGSELMAEYREQLRRRAMELDNRSAVDVPYQLQKLGVPPDALLALRKSVPTGALAHATHFVNAERQKCRTLVLAGSRGIGKTVAAAFVMARWARGYEWNTAPSGGRVRPPAAWIHGADLTSETDFGRVDPEWLDGLKHCRMLVVDDLGKDATQVGLVALRDLLTFRHDTLRPTVVTSNLGPAELVQRYGDSWGERLKAGGMVPALRAEPSLRKRAS